MEFKIIDSLGEVIPSNLVKKDKYLNYVKELEKKYDVKLPNIREVRLARPDFQITKIKFNNNMELILEKPNSDWIANENKHSISIYKTGLLMSELKNITPEEALNSMSSPYSYFSEEELK